MRCHNRIDQILNSRQTGLVVQKYIERPLLLPNGRKFDVRQWILVTSWAPLTIWFYNKCILRVATSAYSLYDLDNKYAHLCNHSINKHNADKHGDDSSAVPSDVSIEQTMLISDDFDKMLGEEGYWEGKLQPELKRIAIACCQSTAQGIKSRAGSFELYGLDIVVDDSLKPWLIEVNFSPDLSHTTKAKVPLVSAMVADMLKVVLDHKPSDAHTGLDAADKQVPTDTGGFELIYQELDCTASFDAVASDRLLCCEGRKLTRRARLYL